MKYETDVQLLALVQFRTRANFLGTLPPLAAFHQISSTLRSSTTLPGGPSVSALGPHSKGRKNMANSPQGIDRPKGEEQPTDKLRAQTSHRTDPDKSASREGTRDPKQRDVPGGSGAK